MTNKQIEYIYLNALDSEKTQWNITPMWPCLHQLKGCFEDRERFF